MLLVALLACAPDADPTATDAADRDAAEHDPDPDADTTDPLPTPQLVTRLSLDLRGVRPSADELAAAEADPAVLDAWVAAWVAAPAFATRVAWIWNDALHTAVWADDYTRFGALDTDTWRALGWEPLAVIEAVVAEDRPFTDIVTADASRADPALAALWGLPYDGDGGWAWTAYDDRPLAGLLSTNGLWQRHMADTTNFNRRRANLVARAFVCSDFFDRDGTFTFSVSDDLVSVETAVRTEPACLTCHAALDPLASFFGGFTERSQEEPLERFRGYSPLQAEWAAAMVAPAWFGHPGGDLVDLGRMIAEDPRFARCAVRRLYEGLTDRSFDDEPAREALIDTFVAGGQRVGAVVPAIVGTPAYRSAEERTLRVEQLATALADTLHLDAATLDDLTWTTEHRLVAGASDDETVLVRNPSPGVGTQVMLDWAARTAVPEALALDRARDPRLLLPADDADADAVRATLSAWYLRFLGRAPDDAAVDRLYTLWEAAGGPASPDAAWEEVAMALVRHPYAVVY